MKKTLMTIILMVFGLAACANSNVRFQEMNISGVENESVENTSTQQSVTKTSIPPTSKPPTLTILPPTLIANSPTATKLPPTETKVVPTFTALPPTQTLKPATSTPRPSTPTSKPPTATKIPPTQTQKPSPSISECRSYSSGKVTCMVKRAYCSYQSGVKGSPTFCNDAPYPSHSFSYVVWGQDVSFLNGHCIVIKGNIEYYNGKPEISYQNNNGFVQYCD